MSDAGGTVELGWPGFLVVCDYETLDPHAVNTHSDGLSGKCCNNPWPAKALLAEHGPMRQLLTEVSDQYHEQGWIALSLVTRIRAQLGRVDRG